MGHICIVEDDASVRELIECTLRSAGFSYKSYENGEEFLKDFAQEKNEVQLILLDIMLPGMNGHQVFDRIMTLKKDARVIFLTAKDTEIDKVTGLNMGADDYIGKPFGVLELIARIKAVLRRSEQPVNVPVTAGHVSLDPAKRKVTVRGETISLTFKEFEMLKYLMLNEGIVLTRDQFLGKIWGVHASIETRTVDMHIKTLREKLGNNSQYIQTVRGVGYKFLSTEV